MKKRDKAYLLDEDLSEADLLILELYEKSAEPEAWDESDDAILAMAHSIHEDDTGRARPAAKSVREGETPPPEAGETNDVEEEDDGQSNVVTFARRKPAASSWSVLRSPLAGFAVAASLMIGVISGQGLMPYLDLGVAPGGWDSTSGTPGSGETSGTRSIRIYDAGQEPEATPAALQVKLDQLHGLLGGYSCANLSVTLTARDQISVAGVVSSVEQLERLRSELSELTEVQDIEQSVLVHGWPICRALEVLGQRTIADGSGARGPLVFPRDHAAIYQGGEALVIEALARQHYQGYLYVDFLQNDGQVVHLLPYEGRADNLIKPGHRVVLGDKGQRYEVGAPYGTDMLVAIVSPMPLFNELRPQVEPADAYFDALDQALEQAVAQGYSQDLFSGYSFIKTKTP